MMLNKSKATCPRCGKSMGFKEYSTDFYMLQGSLCASCGYFLISDGWVDAMKMFNKKVKVDKIMASS